MPPNKHSNENDPADWFYSASDRLRVADSTWRHEGLTHSGIELLQEAAERFLKGYLIAKGWKLNRTHDLQKLLQDAKRFDPGFGAFDAMSKELTEDFFSQHYPGGDWSDIGVNYEAMREQLGQMLELIQQSLPQFFPKPPAK